LFLFFSWRRARPGGGHGFPGYLRGPRAREPLGNRPKPSRNWRRHWPKAQHPCQPPPGVHWSKGLPPDSWARTLRPRGSKRGKRREFGLRYRGRFPESFSPRMGGQPGSTQSWGVNNRRGSGNISHHGFSLRLRAIKKTRLAAMSWGPKVVFAPEGRPIKPGTCTALGRHE